VRDTENNSEQYIATIEEKLAEAEQDREIMQRELDRLENVIERQRSIGRLDNLLAELDNIRHSEQNGRPQQQLNGHAADVNDHDPFAGESGAVSRAVDATFRVTGQSGNPMLPAPDSDTPTTDTIEGSRDISIYAKRMSNKQPSLDLWPTNSRP